jgi:hypothetical protein
MEHEEVKGKLYLDSQKPSEKPNHVHSDDSGIFWEGNEADCPICNPKSKSLTQCPECIWGQKRREFTAVEGAYCKYVIYETCPSCRGEGRIPC